jgi:hypothetical protein
MQNIISCAKINKKNCWLSRYRNLLHLRRLYHPIRGSLLFGLFSIIISSLRDYSMSGQTLKGSIIIAISSIELFNPE